MGTKNVLIGRTESMRSTWGAGATAGLIAGLGMGLILHLGANVMSFIGALYGWPTVTGGWIVHLLNSILIALGFTFLVSRAAISERIRSVGMYIVSGIIYASAVGLVTAGVMLPATMHLRGTQTVPDPIFPLPAAIGTALVIISVAVAHLLYGILLGATYGLINIDTPPTDTTHPT